MKNRDIAIEVFRKIQDQFPHFKMDLILEDKHVDCALEIPVQNGLRVPIYLNLQNSDELHLQVGEYFWLEWFPCNYPYKVEDYFNAVHGILSGGYRILTFQRRGRTEKSHLQLQQNGQWKTIGRYWRYFYTPFIPFGFTHVVLEINTRNLTSALS